MKMIKPKLSTASRQMIRANTSSEQRKAGRALQDLRLKMWSANPHCVNCGRYVMHPHGYELDHIIALADGGKDEPGNMQVLCVDKDIDGKKVGCHADKTNQNMGNKGSR